MYLRGEEVRQAVRSGEWRKPTAGLAPGYVQANLVVLPKRDALEFAVFCMGNFVSCPVLDVTDYGSPFPNSIWGQIDVRTDVPRYRVYRNGELCEERDEITSLWEPDSTAFLIGCSFTFEQALGEAGIPLRHVELGRNVPMYRTNIPCRSMGKFSGPMVVSMRPIPIEQIQLAADITDQFPQVHGAPIHAGDPREIGIADLDKPDFGDPVPVYENEAPVFWACGVTPQAVAINARLPLMITHSPGYMLVTDRLNKDLGRK